MKVRVLNCGGVLKYSVRGLLTAADVCGRKGMGIFKGNLCTKQCYIFELIYSAAFHGCFTVFQ